MKKCITYGVITIMLISLLCACGQEGNNEIPSINEATIESYSTEELQCALGLIKIRQEMAEDVADINSIQIRSIPKVEKHKYDDPNKISFETYITYDITYKNENGGESVKEIPTHIDNTLQTATIYGDMIPYLPNSNHKSFDGTINVSNVNKIVENYDNLDITKELTIRKESYK